MLQYLFAERVLFKICLKEKQREAEDGRVYNKMSAVVLALLKI